MALEDRSQDPPLGDKAQSPGIKTHAAVPFDESVNGFKDDVSPPASGADLMAVVVHAVEAAGITCCFASEGALVYYGAHRMMLQWILCVEDAKLDAAVAVIEPHTDLLQTFRRSAMSSYGRIDHHFPRFKLLGYRCFFHVVPSSAYHLPCTPESLERSKRGLPFPKLDVFAQSLLETMNNVDLHDLVDGMNLTLEWGVDHLDLDGLTDTDWAVERYTFHEQHGERPRGTLLRKGRSKTVLWDRAASLDSKSKRRGHKALPRDETRFRLRGQKDPRELHGW